MSHCGRDTYTAIAPIVSHSAEKMKSRKASKAGVDRKTLGMRGESSPVRKVNRPFATGLTGPKQALLSLQKQP